MFAWLSRLGLSGWGLCGMAMSVGLLAAAADTAVAAAPADQTLDEIIVTAARRPEPRLAYAGSIDRIDRAALELLGAQHYADALNRVPGVLLQQGSGQEGLLAIRSPVLTGAGACGSFLVLEDGLPLRPVGFCNVNELFELNTDQAAGIEVLRGAGPAPYGANAVHGIINVLTPAAAAVTGRSAGLETGADDFRRWRASGRHAGMAFYGSASHDGGWRADSATDEAKLNLLADRAWRGGILQLRAAGTVLNQETAGFIRGLDSYRDLAQARSNANPEAYRDAWSTRIAASWEPASSSNSGSRWSLQLRRSQMSFLQHFLLGKPLERNAQQSLLFSSTLHRESGAWRWQGGFDAEFALGSLLEEQASPTLEGSAAARAIRPAGRHYDYRVSAQTFSAWFSAERQLTARWSLALAVHAGSTGYRYDNRMQDGNTDDAGQVCAFGGCLYSRPADRSDRFRNLAPKLQLRRRIGASQSVYAVVARGFRPPETSELYRLQRQQTTAALAAETLDSAELGWVAERPRWQATVAIFSMRKRHLILRDSNGFNVSDGRTRHEGAEYQLTWQAAPHWQWQVSGTQARHRYDFSRSIDGGETIVAGRDIDTAPRQLQSLRLNYSSGSRWRLELEAQRVGPYFADAANLARYAGHTLANLRVAATLSAHWQASLRVRNLTDRRYADRADFAQGDYRYFPGRDRSAFLQLEWRNE